MASSRGGEVIGVAAMFEALAFISVALRLWTVVALKRRFVLHDILVCIAFILTTALVALVISNVQYGGLGQHAADLITQPEKLFLFGKLLLASTLVWVVAMTFVRLSILSLYIHLFSQHRRFRVVCYLLMAAATAWGIAIFFLLTFDCHPIAFNWDKSIPGGYCVNIEASYLAAHIANLSIDLSIAFAPVTVLWGLQMPARRKIGIIILFALGATVCIFSVIRIALYRLVLGYDTPDFTYTAPIPLIFTVGEPSLGCVIACVPLLRPIAEKAITSTAGSWVRSFTTTRNSSRGLRPAGEGTYADGRSRDTGLEASKLGSGETGHWQRLSEDRKAIVVDADFDQHHYYEMEPRSTLSH